MSTRPNDTENLEILAALKRLEAGDYSARVPESAAAPLTAIGKAVNELALRLEQRSDASVTQGHRALDALDMGYWSYSIVHDEYVWSDTMFRIFGRERSRFASPLDAWVDAMEPSTRPEVWKRWRHCLESGEGFEATYKIVLNSGERRSIYVRAGAECDERGKPLAFHGVAFDRTEELRAEQEKEALRGELELALKQAEEGERRHRAFFEKLPLGISVIDANGNYSMVNPAYCKMLDYAEAEIVGHHAAEFSEDREKPFIHRLLQEMMRAGPQLLEPLERPLWKKDGSAVWTRITSRVELDEHGAPYIFSIIEDLSEQRAKEGERSLLLSEREVIFRSAKFSILTTDLKGIITGFSRETERITGRRASDVLGTADPGFLHDPEEIVAAAKELSAELGVRIEPGFDVFVEKARRGGFDERVWHITNAEGERIPVLLNITGLYDGQGKLYGYMAIGKDISAEAKARHELEAQRIKNIHTSKLASLGEMAGGIAHEINNPLATIQLVSAHLEELANSGTVDLAKIQKFSASIVRTTERIAKIVQGLRSFSRDGSSDPAVPVALGTIVTETISFCQERLRNRGVDLRLGEFPPELTVQGRGVQLSQVLLNLLNNASDAIEELPDKWIAVEARPTGELVEIRISDSGRGIPEETKRRLFEPFFTTKDVGKGTGLGLGIALGIVQAHGGELLLDSAAAHTTFVIRLPRGKAAG